MTETHGTPGDRLAHKRMLVAIDAAIAGSEIYPSGTVFLGADQEGSGLTLMETLAAGKPVLLVHPDGSERLFLPDEALAARSAKPRVRRDAA